MVVAFYFRLHLAYFPRPVVAIFARPEQRVMQARLEAMQQAGIDTEFHVYSGLGHGFGLGTGTSAEGWINDAVVFWEQQMKK